MHKFTKPRPFKANDTIPINIKECIDKMLMWNNGTDKFKRLLEADAIVSTHHTVGKWIRNEWGLWQGSKLKDYFLGLGLTHPDDMSSIIIRGFHRHLNGKPMNIEEEIEKINKNKL